MRSRRIFLRPTRSARVLAALAILTLATLLTAALPSPAARAQANMTVTNGTPPYAVNIPGSPPISFYNSANASRLVEIYNAMKQAAIFCNVDDYNQQADRFNRTVQALHDIAVDAYNTCSQIYNENRTGVGAGVNLLEETMLWIGRGFGGPSVEGQINKAYDRYVQANSDYEAWKSAVPLLPKFPENCNPPTTSTTPQPPPPPPPPPFGTPVGVTIPDKPFTCRTPEVEALIAQLDSAIAQDQKAISNIQTQMDSLSTQLTDLVFKNGPRQQQAELKAKLDSAQAALQKYQQTVQQLEAQKARLQALPPCGAGLAPQSPPPSPPSTPPSAQPLPPSVAPEHSMALPLTPPDGLYAGGKAGWTHLGTLDALTHFEDGGTATDRDRHDEGVDVGGRLGVKQGPWRFEGEFNYRRNGLSEIISTSDPKASGSTQAFTFLGNAIYDFDVPPWWGGVTPHVGAGIGLAHLQAKQKIAGVTLLNSSDTQFAYQAIAGLRVPLAPNWAFDLDYRYLATTDPTYRDTAGNRVTSSYQTHNVIASFTYSFAPPPPLPALFATTPPPR